MSLAKRDFIINTNFKPIPQQEVVFNTQKRLNSCISTRRSGKTSGIHAYSTINSITGKHVGIVMREYEECKASFKLLKPTITPMCSDIDGSSYIFKTKTGGSIRYFTYEAYHKLRGKKFHKVYHDEIQDSNLSVDEIMATLMPCLADYSGNSIFFGTPREPGSLAHILTEQGGDHWAHYKMTAVNNPHISREEIELQKRLLSPLIFAREWEGEFVSLGGVPWLYEAKRDKHLIPNIPIEQYAKTTLCFDFNVNPGTCLVMQKIDDKLSNGGGINFIKEIKAVGGTQAVCNSINRWLMTVPFLKAPLYVTGDFSGSKRDTRSNLNDYQIISKELKIPFTRFIDTTSQNPKLSYSRGLINTAFYNDIVYVDSLNCPILAKEIFIAMPEDSTDQIKKTRSGLEMDSFDAMRYGIHSAFRSIKDIEKFIKILGI